MDLQCLLYLLRLGPAPFVGDNHMNPASGQRSEKVDPPLTVRQVADALIAFIERKPEHADWPVHIIDMGDYEARKQGLDEEEGPWAGLVTKIETDCYDEEQGWVLDLVADRFGPRR